MSTDRKIAVIGAGAIGGLVAGYLKDKGEDVFLVGHKDSVAAIKKNGLNISGVRGDFKIKIDALDELNRKVDLVILAVKTQDIETVVSENKEFLKNTVILTTQNGVQADKILAKYFPKENIISSIVMFGSTYLEPGKITHNFEGKWVIGCPFGVGLSGKGKGLGKKIDEISSILGRAFQVVSTNDIVGMKWLKVFVNANNCLAAITGKSMQETFANLELCKVSMRIWLEGLSVVNKCGIKLVSLPDFPLERLMKSAAMPLDESANIFSGIMTNLSKEPLYGSILQSIKRGRSSEIDFINGEFVALARENGLSAPLNEKLVRIVHKVEESKKFLHPQELLQILCSSPTYVDDKSSLRGASVGLGRRSNPALKNEIASSPVCQERVPRNDENINSPFPKLKLTVTNVDGHCYHGYKTGDEIILEDFTHAPKHFCLGLAHVLFPVIYALSFGAKFPFRDNQRSLLITCPDGGKLEFQAEVFDKNGKIEVGAGSPRPNNGPDPKKMLVEVAQAKGKCAYGYKLGDKWETTGLKCIPDFCGAAFHCAFPALFALNFGAKFFFMDNPDSIDTVTCPDGGNIVFKVSRI